MKHFFTLLFLLFPLSFSFQTQGQIEEKNETPAVSELMQRALKKLEEQRQIEEYLANLEKQDKTKQDQFLLSCSTTDFIATPQDSKGDFVQRNLDKKFTIAVSRKDKIVILTQMDEEGGVANKELYQIFDETERLAIFAMKPTELYMKMLVVDMRENNLGATNTLQAGFFTNVWLMRCE